MRCLMHLHLAARRWDVLAKLMWAHTDWLNGVLLSLCKMILFFVLLLCIRVPSELQSVLYSGLEC